MFGFVARYITIGSNILKQLSYTNPEDRKKFDMQEQMWMYIGLLSGSIIALTPIRNIGLFPIIIIFIIGIAIDNILYLQVYNKVKSNYKK